MPTPAFPTPSSPSVPPPAVTLSGYNASGVSPPSGEASGLGVFDSSGPWAIVTQELYIDYMRFPHLTDPGQLPEEAFALSGIIPDSSQWEVSSMVSQTGLMLKYQARVRCVKTTDIYNTSSFTRPQTFTLLAQSADANGYTYGDASSWVSGMMGPMGSIITENKYFKRTPWNATYDTEYDQNSTTMYQSRSNPIVLEMAASGPPVDEVEWWNNIAKMAWAWGQAGQFSVMVGGMQNARGNELVWPRALNGTILPGSYTYDQEPLSNWGWVFPILAIEHAGARVADGYQGYAAISWEAQNNPGAAVWTGAALTPPTAYTAPRYDASRHDV